MLRSITEEFPPGTSSTSRSITDEEPDVYFHGSTREQYDIWVQQVMQDDSLSPKEREELLLRCPPPEENYEDRMARDSDD